LAFPCRVRGRQRSHRRGYVTRNTESGTRPRTTDSVLNASTPREIEAAFATLVRDRADSLFIMPDAPFISRRIQFATLVARHGIPTVDVEAGGLMSYGTDVLDMYRQVGVYAGQILKGAKPVDLPVVQSTTAHPRFMGLSGLDQEAPQFFPQSKRAKCRRCVLRAGPGGPRPVSAHGRPQLGLGGLRPAELLPLRGLVLVMPSSLRGTEISLV
jgi:hypothetical protein